MNREQKQVIHDAFQDESELIEDAIQTLIDTEIMLEILERRREVIVELLKKRLEEKMDANRSRSVVQ